MGYVVTAPLALIDRQDGTTATIPRGGQVPADVKDEHLQHLLVFNLVGESDEPVSGLEPSRPGDGSDLPLDVVSDSPPARVANKDEWVSYAVAHGMSQADAESATKDQLVERFKG